MGIIGLSDCPDSSAAMRAIAENEFADIVLSGEPDFIGSAGDGDSVDLTLSHYGQDADQSSWEYYKSSLSERPHSTMKAWLRWGGQEFDAYLKCKADKDSDSGFVTHDMPYISNEALEKT